MRQKRAKAYRKLMHLYHISFGFRQPYQVLVDSLMCSDAVAQKIDLLKQLSTVLQGTVKPMITQCCIHELYLQGKPAQPAVDLAKSFERRKCNHKEAIPGDECLASVVGETNKHRYVIATQSQPLRQQLRAIPAVPLVHVKRAVMVLEPPSDMTLSAKDTAEERKLLPSQPETTALSALAGPPPAPPLPKKKRGPKGPNPLSVKKKKPKPAAQPPATTKPKTHLQATAVPHETTSQAGQKRKRAGHDDGEGEDGSHEAHASSGPAGEVPGAVAVAAVRGHRRRRRRKAGDGDGDGAGYL